jgi:hypothetical protein
MKLGDHVFIGEGAVVEAAMVGNFVHIGAGAVIGKFTIIKDCVRIEEGTVVAPNTVIPPFSRVAGRPGVVVEELPETAQESLECGSFPSSSAQGRVGGSADDGNSEVALSRYIAALGCGGWLASGTRSRGDDEVARRYDGLQLRMGPAGWMSGI